MIENNILNSGFLGRDGFRWWVGQIPPRKTSVFQWNRTPQAWGNRVKVRIMGYHPQNTVELKDEDLPWATVILPPTAGSGKAGYKQPIRINAGDVVIGFFLDGDDAQQPVIFGVIGNSSYAVDRKSPFPFQPFSGYDKDNKPEEKRITQTKDIKGDQNNESNDGGQNSTTNVIDADSNLSSNLSNETGQKYRTTSDVMGQCISHAGTNAQSEMNATIKNISKQEI